ncbi:MAG: hypothetical protein K2H38_10400 [Muribaculaceae bacterium]|nr:hypothetical protein [Muribaculaceae bacterium]
MPLPPILDSCKLELFSDESEIRDKYPLAMAERILRIREMYNYWLSSPSIRDRQLRDTIMSRYEVSQSTAYADINLLHQLIPMLSPKTRDFHRVRANEMFLETYAKAKARNDARSMAMATANYAKYNRVDLEDEMSMPYEDIVFQPFCPTLDPTVLGIKPIPNINEHIARLEKELSRDFTDIEDVEYEDADTEIDKLFAPLSDDTDKPKG